MWSGDSFVNIGDQKINEFLDALASKEPTPGGGAVSGLLTALSISLGNMVLAYTEGKKKYADHQSLHDDCGKFLQAARIESMELSTEDVDAYRALSALWKLDQDDPRRKDEWEDAVQRATSVPIRTMELCNSILTTLETMVGKSNKMLVSDLATASIIAKASTEISAWTARINLPLLGDSDLQSELTEKIQALETSCDSLARSIDEACRAV